MERAVIVPHHRNVHLAADLHGTVGGTFLFLDVMLSVCHAQFVERVLCLAAVAAPCGTVDVDGHIGSFLCSAALDFYAVHYQPSASGAEPEHKKSGVGVAQPTPLPRNRKIGRKVLDQANTPEVSC